jgi:hypothetical protein
MLRRPVGRNGRLSALRNNPPWRGLVRGLSRSSQVFLRGFAAMNDALHQLETELGRLQADMVSKHSAAMDYREFARLRAKERDLVKRIAALTMAQRGDH